MSPSGMRRQLGQFLAVGIPGYTVPAELKALVREFDIGGVVLFARNVEGAEQVADLIHEIASLAQDPPMWVAVDQEGGRVARIRTPFTVWPAMAALGRSGDEDLARRVAGAIARELRAVGITMDFAPVLDVLTHAKNPAIGDRALSGDADTVARLGSAMVRGIQNEGVAACGKHFPGHGDTPVDSHHDLPLVEHGPDRLRAVEYVPFRAAMDAGVAAVMVAHLLVPALDPDRPSSLSARTVTGELREGLGFDGLIVTDDLNMKGCTQRFAPPQAALEAVLAGHDLALLCEPEFGDQAAAAEALVHAFEDGRLAFAAVERSLGRHRRAKARYLAGGDAARRPSTRWRDVVGCDAHRRLAAELAAYA